MASKQGKPKKLTPLQAAYNKEITRLKRFERNAMRRGYVFESDFIPERPKRITKKAVERLKLRTPKTEYAKAQYVTPQGLAVSGTEGRFLERSAAARKGVATKAAKAQKPQAPEPEEYPEPPGAPDEAVAKFTAVQQVLDQLGGIPSAKYGGGNGGNIIDLETGREQCANAVWEKWKEAQLNDTEPEYNNYLRDIEGTLAQEINKIMYDDSDQESVNASFSYILELINGGPVGIK